MKLEVFKFLKIKNIISFFVLMQFIFVQFSFSQKKNNFSKTEFKIIEHTYSFSKNKTYKVGKTKYYFNSYGNIVREKFIHRIHKTSHNFSYDIIYEYDNNNLLKSLSFCNYTKDQDYKAMFFYNDKNQMISIYTFEKNHIASDSLVNTQNFIYEKNTIITDLDSFFTYNKKTFDEKGFIIKEEELPEDNYIKDYIMLCEYKSDGDCLLKDCTTFSDGKVINIPDSKWCFDKKQKLIFFYSIIENRIDNLYKMYYNKSDILAKTIKTNFDNDSEKIESESTFLLYGRKRKLNHTIKTNINNYLLEKFETNKLYYNEKPLVIFRDLRR